MKYLFLIDSVFLKTPPELILWFITLYLAPLLLVVLNEVAVNSGSAAAKHKETIKLNLSQPYSGKETMLSPFIFDLNPLLKAKGHILLT